MLAHLVAIVCLLLSGTAFTQDTQPATEPTSEPTSQPATQPAVDAEAMLQRFAGTWTIEAEWADGSSLNGTNIYTPTLNGRAMRAETIITLPDGRQYQRYEGLMRADGDNTIKAYVMTFDGSFAEGTMQVVDADTVRNGFANDDPIRETITFNDDDTYAWIVEQKTDDGYTVIMNGLWTKQPT